MVRSNIEAKAIYVVRHCGKQKLEGGRLQAYLDAAKAMMAQKPINNITNSTQVFMENTRQSQMLAKDKRSQQDTRNRRTCLVKEESFFTNKPLRGRGGLGPGKRGGAHRRAWSQNNKSNNDQDLD